jgi:hypothetical protein
MSQPLLKGWTLVIILQGALRKSFKYIYSDLDLILIQSVGQMSESHAQIQIIFTAPGYWNGLTSSTKFAEEALEKCLYVIHGDIITV